MAPRRWLLFALSVGALLVLAYGGVLLAFSVPVTAAMQEESRLPGATQPEEGTRALVVPFAGPGSVATFASGQEGWQHWPGALLVVADNEPDFPASVVNASIVRALAHVAPGAQGAYDPPTLNLTGVPHVEGGNVTERNLTLDVSGLAQGGKGFLVKADASGEVRFVPEERVVGRVERFESTGSLLLVLVTGAIGFVAPLVFLVATHRPSGRPGIHDAVCAECRRPLPAGSDFCPGCGAWRRGGGS